MRDLPRIAFGVSDLFTAFLVIVGVFVGLPARWFVADLSAAVAALFIAASLPSCVATVMPASDASPRSAP